MTEPPEPRRPEEDGGEDETDWDELERNAARDFVADSTPDMQEAINAARDRMGDEAFDDAVAEVLRRVREKEAAERLAREQLERVHELTGDESPVTDEEVQGYLARADQLRYGDDLAEELEDEEFAVLDDDVVLDLLGSGEDVADGELTDLLGAWRDDVDSDPLSPGTAPEVVQQIHDFTQEIDRATTPPRSTEGSAAPMSMMDDANQVRSLGASAAERAHGALNELLGAVDKLMDWVQIAAQAPDESTNAAADLLGEGHPGRTIVLDATAAWNNSLDPIRQQVQAIRQAVTDAQARAGAVGEAFNNAANTASGGGGS